MNRKTPLLFLAAFFTLMQSYAQEKISVKKFYGFKQANLPGIQPNTSEGTGVKEIQTTYNYWFYFVLQKSEKINVTEIWISGIKFSVKNDTVKKIPVYKIMYTAASGNDTLTLVPYTKNPVLLSIPAAEIKDSAPKTKYLNNLVKDHELVITYYRNGKKFYKVLKKITELEPEARM